MQRTVIHALPDTHIAIDLERDQFKGGNSHQRKLQRKLEEKRAEAGQDKEWWRIGRIILRDGVPAEVPVKFKASTANITLLPFGSEEIKYQADDNHAVAYAYRNESEGIVQEIALRTHELENPAPKPRKRTRVVIVEEDEPEFNSGWECAKDLLDDRL